LKGGENMMLRTATIIILAALLSACASGTQVLRQVDPGMSSAQVEQIMGKCDGFSSVERDGHTYTLYQYINRYCNWNQSMWDKCDFFIILKDDRVIETGVKDVRSANPNMQFMYIFKHP